jgi:hypothetical protein
MSLQSRLESRQKAKNSNHDAILQVKITRELRDRLQEQLSSEGLTIKDLVLSAIEEYLGEDSLEE